MEYTNLGRSGLKVSRICLGMMSYGDPAWREWVLAEPEAEPFVRRALEAGINFFDTANMYSRGVSEEITGRLLRKYANRDEVVIATKVFFPTGDRPNQGGLSRKHILEAIDASLTRLGLDHVDLYQIHRWDPETPIEETLDALHEVVRAGKARYIGASSMFAWQLARSLYLADRHGWTRFISMQNHYNLIYREEEREVLPLCREEGLGVIPWSPLARGLLAGARNRDGSGTTVRSRTDTYGKELYGRGLQPEVVERVVELASRRGCFPAQIALAWLLSRPAVVAPIIGATRPEHLDQAVAAVDIRLEQEEIDILEEPYQPQPIRGH
jgi:aryl-alcohol dehydrogenase-like predicted oxidoreductase